MKTSCRTSIVVFLCCLGRLVAQSTEKYTWHDLELLVSRFEGQGWENIGFQRLPENAKDEVRDAVWSLSRHAAGLGIRFEADTDSLFVEYQVEGNLAMYHMPATGVSGIDLYVKNGDDWFWCRGKYHFDDTVRYNFKIDQPSEGGSTFQLYFPLYNAIKNLKIGVLAGSNLEFLTAQAEKPIVVYGTSIAQGACASRPGMAWTNILQRKLNYPVINLGFSGNGRLEPELIDLIAEIDASIFVLDCLPNLGSQKDYPQQEVQKRIRNSVESLRKKHPQTPIVLVQHAGYSDGLVDSDRQHIYTTLNKWMTETFENLQKEGVENIVMLTKNEIALSNDAFVDGTHPTDLGMEQYATAYEKIVSRLLKIK